MSLSSSFQETKTREFFELLTLASINKGKPFVKVRHDLRWLDQNSFKILYKKLMNHGSIVIDPESLGVGTGEPNKYAQALHLASMVAVTSPESQEKFWLSLKETPKPYLELGIDFGLINEMLNE